MKPKSYLYLSVVLIITAILSASFPGKTIDYSKNTQKAQSVFYDKLSLVEETIQSIKDIGFENALPAVEDLKDDGISILVFKNDSLVFWSDNSIPLNKLHKEGACKSHVVRVLHNTYYCFVDTNAAELFVGIIHLESKYPYKNKFLVSGVNPDFRVAKGTQIDLTEGEAQDVIKNKAGELVFKLDYSKVENSNNKIYSVFASLLLILGLLFLLNYLRLYLKELEGKKKGLMLTAVFAGLLIARISLLISGVLANSFYLFDPFIYATSIAPTFGDLVLNTIIFSYFSYLVYSFVRLPERYLTHQFNRNAWRGILNVFFILTLVYAYSSSLSIISHSSIKVVVHNISQLRTPTIIAYCLFALNYLGLMLVVLWVFKMLKDEKLYRLVINIGVLLFCTWLAGILIGHRIDLYTIVFAFLLYLITGLLQEKLRRNAIFSSLVLYLLLFSVYILLFTVYFTEKKDIQQNKSLAVSLSTEHDPIAEYLFEDLTNELQSDSNILASIEPEIIDVNKLYGYLAKNYFNGYWKKYQFTITVCTPADSVVISNNGLYWYPCYSFFKEIIDYNALSIPESKFYYVDKYTGLINYLGWIKYSLKDGSEISVFIEFDSKLTTKPLGYPELLLDEGLSKQTEIQDYSYAKYYKGDLISHEGNYEYSLISKVFKKLGDEEFYQVRHNNYVHLVYHSNDENIIIVSEPEVKFVDYIVLFSYIFVFYYLLAIIVVFLLVSRYRHISFRDSLKNKIQFSVISILIVSLLLIAGSTTWFNIRKHNQTQFRILKEKISSVYVELEHKLAYEEELTENWSAANYDNLDQLLVKFSDVFYSDINLFDLSGNLLATSRNQIFQLGLQSKKMNPLAFDKMSVERLAQYVHKEQISNLSYLAAYVPFVNSQGKLLAYLNLPYFSKQKELQEDITTITVAIINIYVLLILLTILITVVISDQITKPLEMLQARFRGLKLGAKYEPIEYSRNDEIGRLVNEYNIMVLELEKSIDLLAKSERESAWREMAKQVAHEIKNPLTPMRLSVQQLQRTWNDKSEGFEQYLSRVTETLIEQIDNLSAIAGEFSNFAKMPVAKIEDVNLNTVLEASLSLFNAHERADISLKLCKKQVWVKADSDQLSRVFINIIKNGIQAIPETRKGKIEIKLSSKKNRAIIEIADDGKGIAEDIQSKLFVPNFTTKSGGMGLGLGIVKNILDNIDGEINFKTVINKGSTFIVSIPEVES